MSLINNSKNKYSIVLMPFDQSNAELLKATKTILLTEFNLKIFEIQEILNNLPDTIFSSDDLEEITSKHLTLINTGTDANLVQHELDKENPNIDDVAAVSSDQQDPDQDKSEPADSMGLSTADEEDEELITEILEDESNANSADYNPEEAYQQYDSEQSIPAKWRRFHNRYGQLLDPVSEILPFVLIGAIVLFLTNSLLLKDQEDPTAKVQKTLQELQSKRIEKAAAQQLYFGLTGDNEQYTAEGGIFLNGELLQSTLIKLSFKQTSEPNPDDILLGRNIPTLVKDILIDSNVGTKIKDGKYSLKTLARVEVEKAYQRYVNYFEVKLRGEVIEDGKHLKLEFDIENGKSLPEIAQGETWAEVASDGTISVKINQTVQLKKTKPPKKKKVKKPIKPDAKDGAVKEEIKK